MRHHIAFKALAIVLASLCLLAVLISASGIAALFTLGLYESTIDEVYSAQMENERQSFAVDLVYAYATLNLGHIPREYFQSYYGFDWKTDYFREGFYYYSIYDQDGRLMTSTVTSDLKDASFYEIKLTDIIYRRIITDPEDADPNKSIFTDNYYDETNNCYVDISYQATPLGDCTVQLYLLPHAYNFDTAWRLLQDLYFLRQQLFWILGCALLGFVIVIIFLCCAAGKSPDSNEIRPGGLNRLPLDIYTVCCISLWIPLLMLASNCIAALNDGTPELLLLVLILIACLFCVSFVGLLFAWAAQMKVSGIYWLKNTLVGRILILLYRITRRLARLLPVMWQWVFTAMAMGIVPFTTFLLFLQYRNKSSVLCAVFLFLFAVSILADIAISLYGSYCYGTLMKGAKRMSKGNLLDKVSPKYMIGCFRDFAVCLNTLSDTTYRTAEKHMRSERMKTELITNVSHDIKTPLTSIINFVDLLQKPHTPEQGQEYLEVLARQSNQMKILIEDLMELSKANSGNIAVNLDQVDLEEAMNQALGEFSDRLEAVNLMPVFRHPEAPVCVLADGHHVWRILFNLLTNAIKYALPGTRLYIDLTQAGKQAALSIKNISRTELNITADELMERFVQGDSSRRSEGSGLGLNIAKSLMEVQNGKMELQLDGDLFKVTLLFPLYEEVSSQEQNG